MTLEFTVPGAPVGKGRPRMTKAGHTYTPQNTVQYENFVRYHYYLQCGRAKFDPDIPLDVRMVAYFPIPKSLSKKKQLLMRKNRLRPTKKPDCDNIAKSILDALNNIAYHDDSQVVDHQLRKFYSDDPRVTVKIIGIEQEEW